MSELLWLTKEEVAKICAPLVQPSAQCRKLERMGLVVHRTPRGTPIVGRRAYEMIVNHPPPPEPEDVPWVPPEPVPWEETPLGRGQAAWRQAKAQIEAEAEQERRKHAPSPAQIIEHQLAHREAVAEKHASVVRYHAAKRRVLKLQRTAAWADHDAIRALYAEARRLSRSTGIPHHVDHKIPLQGALVSGLHVHQNLQILTGSENSRKRNSFEVQP